ncbi:KTSC domain-containing protein [Sinorhizobium mexicanum]|uniref:KTSC domain-containing protein n=1 Tax=Sinorhizobium mexicanum TaxID=375549 RepID=A0A859QL87_9HYPH|nr:KTSC domain-containing protein [Sinorhizobium mexicanum]QLL65834.1 KTSC domain-containing protein [Sinorhizobium mexicanum]
MPSHLIKRTDYDPETRTLSVWLVTSENRYDYDDVPPETYAAFRRAFSKGRFFNRHIRDRFRFRVSRPG